MSTLTVIDFDDTLFPTTWAHDLDINLNNCDSIVKDILSTLDNKICEMIIHLHEHGDIIIISNGSKSWIQKCINNLPQTSCLVEIKVIKIISARDLFEDRYKSHLWKDLAFKCYISKHFHKKNIKCQIVKRILSLGDSKYEHDALTSLDEFLGLENYVLTSIIFKKKPELNDILMQLDKFGNQIKDVLKDKENKSYKLHD